MRRICHSTAVIHCTFCILLFEVIFFTNYQKKLLTILTFRYKIIFYFDERLVMWKHFLLTKSNQRAI